MIITNLPANEPEKPLISMDELKSFCRIDDDLDAANENDLLIMLAAAVETGEHLTGLIWQAASYEARLALNGLRCSEVAFPVSPVFKIESMVYALSSGGTVTTLPGDYHFEPSANEMGRPKARLKWLTLPPVEAIEAIIKFTAGWEPGQLPRALKLWTLNRVASAYDNRSDLQESIRIPTVNTPREHSERLLDRWKWYGQR